MSWVVTATDVAGELETEECEGLNVREALFNAMGVQSQLEGVDEGTFTITIEGAA